LRILHFSDTHNDLGINQREADFYDAFAQVIDAIVEIKPDYVIHTGDLFHRPHPSKHVFSESYRQIFLISHETEIKEMFERVVEL